MIDGTYTALAFAETLNGQQTTIGPIDGYFTIPAASGYVFVTGGNATDTMIWMTWSDWVDEANGGVFQAYTQSVVDLSGVMVNFPDGLMRVGNFYDEINLNTQAAYSRIEKLEYTDENLEAVIASGVPYDTDTNYIYAVRASAATYSISLSGEYTVSDHGMEMFTGSTVPVYASSLYGQDLKGKLRRDVVTISQQMLTAAQQEQVLNNIGVFGLLGSPSLKTFSELYNEIPGTSNHVTFVRLGNALTNSLIGYNRQAMAMCFAYVSDYIEMVIWDTSAQLHSCSVKRSDNSIEDLVHYATTTSTSVVVGSTSCVQLRKCGKMVWAYMGDGAYSAENNEALKNGSTTITIPQGYRPSADFRITDDVEGKRLAIKTNGNIINVSGTTLTNASLRFVTCWII